MKSVLLTFAVFISSSAFCQKAMTIKKASDEGTTIEQLDGIYKSGIHSYDSLAVFNDNFEAFTEAYYQLLRDFGKFLSSNNFTWETTTRCWNRIYFNKDGKVDYFLYQFNTEISEEMKVRFDELLNEFIKDYQFPMSADVPFSQCSPVNYKPK
jgi:hypothetical protein